MVIYEGHRWSSRCDLRLASYPKWYRKVYNGTCIYAKESGMANGDINGRLFKRRLT